MPESVEDVRARTLPRLSALGFPEPPPHFPLLADADALLALRPVREVAERLAVLNVRVSLAFGMPSEAARAWLSDNGLTHCLSAKEQALVAGAAQVDEQEQTQVEALWALSWVVSLFEDLNPADYCGEQLVALLPDLRELEPFENWTARMTPTLRPAEEVVSELDLLFAMTWGVTDSRLAGKPSPGTVAAYVHWERRRALEFAVANPEIAPTSWDEIDLST
jgi:hypothetical protein